MGGGRGMPLQVDVPVPTPRCGSIPVPSPLSVGVWVLAPRRLGLLVPRSWQFDTGTCRRGGARERSGADPAHSPGEEPGAGFREAGGVRAQSCRAPLRVFPGPCPFCPTHSTGDRSIQREAGVVMRFREGE